MTDMQSFFDAMHEKFLLRATGECHHCDGSGEKITGLGFSFGGSGQFTTKEKCSRCDGKGKFNRSLTPWSHYDWEFLRSRLAEEFREFLEDAPGPYEKDHSVTDAAADELLDIANFAAFLWLKWKGECKHEFAYLFDLAEHQQCKHCKVTK